MNSPAYIDVSTGEVKTAGAGNFVYSSGIGSCIVLTVYDARMHRGGIAHMMLPGRSDDERREKRLRCIENGVEELNRMMSRAGSKKEDRVYYSVGGGNVLRRQDDAICRDNIASIKVCLADLHITPLVRSYGGFCRRSVRLDCSNGLFYYSTGNNPEKTYCPKKHQGRRVRTPCPVGCE